MKKIKLTEANLTKIITKVIKEQELEGDPHVETHEEDVDTIEDRIAALEERLNGLEEDYTRKIGYGDHHHQLHKL